MKRDPLEILKELYPVHRVDDATGYFIALVQMVYNVRLIVVKDPHKPTMGYDDAWCYDDIVTGIEAFASWLPTKESEPTGWVKHPISGRRNGERLAA